MQAVLVVLCAIHGSSWRDAKPPGHGQVDFHHLFYHFCTGTWEGDTHSCHWHQFLKVITILVSLHGWLLDKTRKWRRKGKNASSMSLHVVSMSVILCFGYEINWFNLTLLRLKVVFCNNILSSGIPRSQNLTYPNIWHWMSTQISSISY